MKCPCGFDGHPAQQLNDSGNLVDSCPSCGEHARFGGAEVKEPTPKVSLFKQEAAKVTSGPIDVIASIRARLTFLDTEISACKAYEIEAKKLRKMLKVAERTELKSLQKAALTGSNTSVSGDLNLAN